MKKLLLVALVALGGFFVYRQVQADRAEQDLWTEATDPVAVARAESRRSSGAPRALPGPVGPQPSGWGLPGPCTAAGDTRWDSRQDPVR